MTGQLPPLSGCSAIIAVGGGRGFIVEAKQSGRIVITAGHCLPHLPPACSYANAERIYPDLLGALGAECRIWARCLFVDPIADIAVLGWPEGGPADALNAYDRLVEPVEPLTIGTLPDRRERLNLGEYSIEPVTSAKHQVQLPSLENEWFRCTATRKDGLICIFDASEYLRPGMSGSPIVSDGGDAVGVFVTATGGGSAGYLRGEHREGGPNPHLLDALPGWLLRELGIISSP
jgi:hypothetical protein